MFEENGVYKALKLTGYTNHRRGFVQARGLAMRWQQYGRDRCGCLHAGGLAKKVDNRG